MKEARVLVVEDEEVVARTLQRHLQDIGFRVGGLCNNGPEAIAVAMAEPLDLVLMDVHLDGPMDGIETARLIRERINVPLVFLTALADPDTIERAKAISPHGYLVKPFDQKALHASMVMALCRHQAESELEERVRERTLALARSELRFQRLAAVEALTLMALRCPTATEVFRAAVESTAHTLEVDRACIVEQMAEGPVVVRALVGWRPAAAAAVLAGHEQMTHASACLDQMEPVLFDTLAEAHDFATEGLREEGIAAGAAVAVQLPGEERACGILLAHHHTRRLFSPYDVQFLRAVANVVGSAVARDRANEQRITAERLAGEERLRLAQAQQAVQARDEFLAVASHELNTPLTTLRLEMDSLARLSAELPPLVTTKIGRARRSTERLVELVDTLLDVSRMRAGDLVLNRERVDLGQLAAEVVDQLAETAAQSGSSVHLHRPEPVVGLWDRLRLAQVLTNLLTNAFKYGESKPIDLFIRRLGDNARIVVRDRGPGVATADRERVFARFERASPINSYGGLGLGLYVTRNLVEAHGGTVHIAEGSDDSGSNGATFVVEIPLGLGPSDARRAHLPTAWAP